MTSEKLKVQFPERQVFIPVRGGNKVSVLSTWSDRTCSRTLRICKRKNRRVVAKWPDVVGTIAPFRFICFHSLARHNGYRGGSWQREREGGLAFQ